MNIPMKTQVALVLGGSGETGKEVLRQLSASSVYSKVISLGRRVLDLPSGHEKVDQVLVDFDRLEDSRESFKNVDTAFICLGTTRAKSGVEGFIKVDLDYVVSAAKLLKESECPDLHLLTSSGSNPNSWLLYPSTKGKAEEALKELSFPNLAIYRPRMLLCKRSERRFVEGLIQSAANVLDPFSWWSITTVRVAQAMVENSLIQDKRASVEVIEHPEIITRTSDKGMGNEKRDEM